MSFIKRSDGVTIYGGTHDTVRSFGGGKNMVKVKDEEGEGGDIGIESAMMTIGESAYFYGDEEVGQELAEELWGAYDGECGHLNKGNFGDLFRAAGR
jgi:hypothetical protein